MYGHCWKNKNLGDYKKHSLAPSTIRVMCAWLPFIADCTTTDLLAMLCLEVLSVSVLPICSERKKEKNNACGC